jgi:predicted dithiol-disulfide oxidoreductase (DUF899 family)
MPEHRTATREEWTVARTALLTREKELTRMGDELARERRELPWVAVLNEQPALRGNLPLVAIQNASSSGTSLDGDFSEGHGISTFTRERGTVYHCYSSYARGTEFLMGYYAILDRAPTGRDEGDQPMGWLRRHDEYRLAEGGMP